MTGSTWFPRSTWMPAPQAPLEDVAGDVLQWFGVALDVDGGPVCAQLAAERRSIAFLEEVVIRV